MKKLLSLVLALSLCLSSVILLASCKGPSAYEVAVENGFTGSETEWLESLKGPAGEAGKEGDAGNAGAAGYPGLPGQPGLDPHAYKQFYENYTKTVQEWLASLKGTDGKDGHNVTVTINENGYWVIDGTRQPVKVTGEPVKVLSVELVNNVFTVVKGNATVPTLEMKVKFDDGSEDVLPVSNSVIANTSYDLTKEGAYPVTLSYGGVTATDTVTVEGLMVYYQNFNDLSNSSTMAEICAATGFTIPCIGDDNPRTAVPTDGSTNGEEVLVATTKTWFDDGSDITPYLVRGTHHGYNYPNFKVVDGKLWYRAEKTNGLYGASDSMLVFADDTEMNFAATGVYTLQMDIMIAAKSDNGTPDDTSDDIGASVNAAATSNILFMARFRDDGTANTDKNHNRPDSIGAAFGAEYLMANVHRIKGGWRGGDKSLSTDGALPAMEASEHAQNVLSTLFPESETGSWIGETITVRIVISPRTVENPGYVVYMKKATDSEDQFVKVGEFNATTVTEAAFTAFMDETSDGFGIFTRSAVRNDGAYMLLDNIAAWTGDGNMPTNTSTATYEELNTAYNASLPAPEETPAA